MRPTSGLTFGGRYQLSNRIAIGGMGEVWQASDLVIGRTVAIKILKDEYLGDPGFLERFRAEARHAALVNHEGIANVFDYGEEEGSAYLVMELVPGESLATILERERVLPTDRVLDIVAQTASALHAAHSAGLVHRDVKPGNLLITPDGRVKITDFGIARIADQVPLTATGQVMGTVQYLSPEQASGNPASPATDVYSLGIVAYEALAGRRPFTGESQVAIAMAQINDTPADLPVTVAEPVRNLVMSCLAKKPEDRPASAAHLSRAANSLRRGDVGAAAAAVPAVLSGTVDPGVPIDTQAATRVLPSAAPVGGAAGPSMTSTRQRNPWTWPLIALIGILLLVLAGTLIALFAQPSTAPEEPSTSPSVSEEPSPSPSPSTSPSPDMVTVNAEEYIGMTESEVRTALGDLGLAVTVQTGSPATDPSDVGRVYSVDPTGTMPRGSTVNVLIYDEIPPPPKPSPMSAEATSAPAGSVINVSWPIYNACTGGTSLTAYEFTIENGTISPNPALAGTNNGQVTLPDEPGQVRVSYNVSCNGIKSPSSDQLVLTAE